MQHDLKALDSDLDNKNNLLDGVWLISPVLKFLVKLKHIGSGSNGCGSGFRQVLALPTEIPSPFQPRAEIQSDWRMYRIWIEQL